ncbi:MAG: DUF751 domain-containing protein, partial [Cryomorphaceae bacterium]|nr:DUF751 domain-containing protein [Cryomorphaceae bacterium]
MVKCLPLSSLSDYLHFGTFYVIYDWIKPLAKERPLFLGLVITFMIALFMFMYFTLEAMLGI